MLQNLCKATHKVWLFALILAAFISPAHAQRIALVIGNSSYEDRPLKNPANDAQDLATALTAAGFKVTLKKNLNADGMKEAISEFGDALRRENDTGLFYFSGHGVQTAKGNYLLPVGRAFKRDKDVELFAVEARSVLSEMQQAKNPLNILILDACRDSPLPSAEKSMGSKGLARMDAPSGSVIAFATAPGKTASDNAAGRNGLYTKHLISAINTPGLRLEDVFKRVGAAVEKESARQGGDQSPEEVMKLRSELPFYFKGGPGVQTASLRAEPTDNPGRSDPEEDAWHATRAAKTLAAYDAYLNEFPKGRFASAARVGRVALQGQSAPPQPMQQQEAAQLRLTGTSPQVRFQTSMGDIVIEVYPDKAPQTVENFLRYVNDKHYDGTIFHRVIDNFMIQGGGYTVPMNQRPTRPPIPLEAFNGLKNDAGTVAMARTSKIDSATAQFFINVKNNDFLNAKSASDGYTVFGKVITGMDAVQRIQSTPTATGDVPKTAVVINSVTMLR